ncbi:hypothetical protein IJD34_09665 [bacterium]|nr:hypothetical protein [bacterium]
MINNITNVDTRLRQAGNINKANPSLMSIPAPPIIGFKSIGKKEKATIRVKKFKRSDNIIIVGEIDDDYVDIVETSQANSLKNLHGGTFNFFQLNPEVKKTKFLKNCYIIDYIQSPKPCHGMGTEAIKELAEKAMLDNRAEGRIVTYCAPIWKEASPAIFFYKLGFRFMEKGANEYIAECIRQKIPDSPPQQGMMYLPKNNLHKLLRYGDVY